MLSCGLIGLPGCGKTTLFTLLTGPSAGSAFAATQTRRVAKVPDERVDTLARHFAPKKTTYAQIEVTDVPGLVPGERSRTAHFLEAVRGSDALVYVLRDNPAAELATLEAELILADLAAVEGRIERLETGPDGHVSRKDAAVHATLVRVRDHLGEGKPFSDLSLGPAEAEALAHTAFLSSKPVVWVLNAGEDELPGSAGRAAGAGNADAACRSATGDALGEAARSRDVPLVAVSALVEKEIAELPPAEASAFLADLGLEEPGIARLARAVYEKLGLISFLTAGEDEVRAWTIKRGMSAKAAAGKIHSDIERGFIRAEVVAYGNYLKAAEAVGGGPGGNGAGGGTAGGGAAAAGRSGSSSLGERAMVTAKEKALMRLEGKDYVVQDGDIVNFRFNV